jgi:hypothetical protein
MEEDKFGQEASQLILVMARSLVDSPKEVEVTASAGNFQTVLFSLKCAKSDLGKVIGRGGKTAAAMRQIISSVAAKHGKRAVLDIEE